MPDGGAVFLEGKDINRAPGREIAKKLAILPQNPHSPEGLTVWDLVSFGRHPHKASLERINKKDEDIIKANLEKVDLWNFRDRPLDKLSGGQRQRAWMAMALCQETRYLLLDEPIAFLDLHYQFEILELLKGLKNQKSIVLVLHDLNMASLYGDFIVLLKEGVIYASGEPGEILNQENLSEVFGIVAHPVKSQMGTQFIFSWA
jgi:iron complex transport system ATP-binding protein